MRISDWSSDVCSSDLVYPDAVDALRRWDEAGYRQAVYSSGSVPAQRLLFGNSDAGDLLPLFDAFFDTAVGHKREAGSYRGIRSEERREGKECVSTCSSRGAPDL